MDADSSYGGSDTAQDSTCGNENTSLENSTIITQSDTPQNDVSHNSNNLVSTISVNTEENPYYNKNEITLPINRDETDFKSENTSTRLPNYLTTANLNINETLEHHSNLEALSKQYRSTSYLNADTESPPNHRKSGLDNPAFDDEEEAKEKQSIKSSFDQSKPYNGDLNLSVNSSIQNDEPLTEAVNLELINLKPSGKDVTGPYENGKNGMTSIPIKPDVDAELGNPYDEYFVPVNEHKKYMRGEKLYVTMDKRNVKKKSRCLCWGVCISIVLAAVIVGILAAVGVIGTKPVQEVSSRQFSGSTSEVKSGGIFGLPADLDTSDTSDDTPPKYTPGPSSSTAPYPLTTDMTDISVPRALESQIKIDNLAFDSEYANKSSKKYQDLASTIEAELKEAIFSDDELMYGPANIEVKVIDFTEGSVIARYRITWIFKHDAQDAKDPIDVNLLDERMAEKMRQTHNQLAVFQINEEASMNKTTRVLDSCKIQNFGCEFKCLFDYTSAEFICTCPEGQVLNVNRKNCDKTSQTPLSKPSYDDKQLLESIPEPTSEPEPHAEPERIPKVYSNANSEPYAEPTSEPHAEPTSEPHAEPTSEPHVEPTSEPHAEPTSEPHAEPTSEPHAEPTSEPHAQPTSKSHVEPTSEPQAEPITEPHAEPTSEPHAEPISEPNVEPTSETHAEPISEPHVEPTSEPHAEPTSDPHSESTSEAHAEPTSEHHDLNSSLESQTETKAEPNAEPTSEPHAETTVEPEIDQASHVQKESIIVDFKEITTEAQTNETPETFVNITTEPEEDPIAEPTPTSDQQSSSELIMESTDEMNELESNTESAFEKEFITFQPPTEPQIIKSNTEHSIGTTAQVEQLNEVNRKLNISSQPDSFITAADVSGNSELTTTKSENIFEFEGSTQSESLSEQESTTESLPQFVENEASETSSDPTVLHQDLTTTTMYESKTENELVSISHSTAETLPDFNTEIPVVDSGSNMDTDINILSEEHSQQSTIEISTPTSFSQDIAEMSTEKETLPIEQVTTVMPLTTIPLQDMESDNATTLQNNESSTSSLGTKNFGVSQDILVTINPHLFGQNEEQSTESLHENIQVINKTMDGVKSEKIISKYEEAKAPEKLPEAVTQLTTSRHVEQLTERTNKNLSDPHPDILINEPNEYSNHLEIMSPFLPEIENDTFINSLRSDDHFVDHNMHSNIDSSDELVLTTKPPRLDNDQQNKTNPLDPNPTGAMSIDQENFIKDQVKESSEPSTESITNDISNSFRIGKKDDNPLTNVTYYVMPNESENKNNQVNKTEPIALEILNNVHSNSFFDKNEPLTETTKQPDDLDETTFERTTMEDGLTGTTQSELRSKLPDLSETIDEFTIFSAESSNFVNDSSSKNDTDISSSTEDLIAMETTTYGVKLIKKSKSIKYPSEKNEIQDNSKFAENTQQKEDEKNNKFDTSYAVEETVLDSTTTTKLFVTKPTTIDPLSSEPPEDVKKDLDNFSENTNTLNDISNEDLLNKPGKIEEITLADVAMTSQMLTENYKNIMKNERDFGKELKLDEPLLTTLNEIATKSTNDVRPVTEGFTIMGFTRCESDQFQCVNSTSVSNGKSCIPMVDRCDSVVDCSDGSDEINCKEEGCPNNFQCASGQCLKRHLVCDGIVNCNDNSDEVNCESWNCTSSEFSCGERDRCIPSAWKCDGRSHCRDSSDENGCSGNECHVDHFLCPESGKCIPNAWKCDGKTDCPNGEDETQCGCSNTEFKCKIGGGCINLNQVCDGVPDCGDKSDEWNCLMLQRSTSIVEAHLKNETSFICSNNWNATYSDIICEAMGYDSSGQYEEIPTPPEAKKLLKIKDKANYSSTFLMNLEDASSCENIVTVKCQRNTCGIRSDSVPIIGDILNNETYNLPSLTLLYNKKQNAYCSGSLISQSWVVTAYSCIVGSLNGLDMSPVDWTIKIRGQQRMVVDFIEHPKVKFSNFYYNNDVVLIKLDRPVTTTRNVSAVCVPEGVLNDTLSCAIAGWKNIQGDAAKRQYFHYVTMPLISIQECNSTEHYNGMMSQSEICVESKQSVKFPCYDDIGAPLLCLSEKTKMWELQGILSHSNKCKATKHPLVYTSVNKEMVTWIENTIGQAASVKTSL